MVAVAEKKPIALVFGRRLRGLREAKGWTQAELGERSELLYQDISRMERGERIPSFETLLKLADALDEPLDSFRVSTEEDTEPPGRSAKRK